MAAAAPIVQPRLALLGDAPELLAFLFAADADVTPDADAIGSLRPEASDVLDAALDALASADRFAAADVEAALRAAIVDGLGLKPRFAFGPLRVAVSGRRVSPPRFESMEILGRESVLARLRSLRSQL